MTGQSQAMSAHPPTAVGTARVIPLASPFALEAGGALVGAKVALETYGELDSDRSNAILILTGLSASAHAAAHPGDPSLGWWEAMIGPGRALDTRRVFVSCVKSLGSCFGSTGPASTDPATGQPYGASFPELRIEDIARASQAAVDHLGIGTLAAVIGTSLGGMTSLAHVALFPGRARRLISISGALAATTGAIATRSLQREIVGSALRAGQGSEAVANAMKIARKIGVLSYIGGELLEKKFGRMQSEPFSGSGSGTDFEVEHWLDHLGDKFARSFDPWSYWQLSRAMDLFEFARFGDTLSHAARRVQVESALIIGVTQDLLFPALQQREIAETLAAADVTTQYVELSSPAGHDAFLTESGLFTPVMRHFLEGLDTPRPPRGHTDPLRPQA
jgi:homoserine O-acetyltransferase